MSGTELDVAAADALHESWGVTRAAKRARTGTSRDTWSVDGELWLSHADAAEETPFRREAELLHCLPLEIARCGATWQVPEVVPTVDGRVVAASATGVWRLTRHLAGEHPDLHEPATYAALPSMLVQLHAVLGSMSTAHRVRERGIAERAPELVGRYAMASFAPATQDAREGFAVRSAAQWLAPRLQELAGQPRQLTHGDWIPPNLRVTVARWGVLDWEACRVDPVVMDLAQSCCTLLIWSGLDAVAERIEELVQRYCEHAKRVISSECVRVAMLLYWLHNYHHWRERHEAVGRYADHLSRQPGRLLAVGKFVGAVRASDADEGAL
jgi:Ser/Thr protein kinase RdoA (MazF antagonist)